MAAAQTGSKTISAHRTAKNEIPRHACILSMSPGSTKLCLCFLVAKHNRNSLIQEIHTAAAQTGSNTVSAHRTARNKISTAVPIFSRSSCSTVLSTMSPEVAGMGCSAHTRPHTHVYTFCERVLRLRLLQSSTTSLNSSTSKTCV